MKILVVHQHYLSPGAPGGSRFNEFARLWQEAGHEVTVVAGTLNYATGETPEAYRGRWVTKEQDGATTVLRAHVPGSYSKGTLGRMWAFFGFTLSASTAALLAGKHDVVIATSPPLITVIPGWMAAHLHLRPVPWVFEVRDLWPESAVTTGVLSASSPITKILSLLERFACASADAVNVLTPAFADNIVERGLAPRDKLCQVTNGADIDLFQPRPRDNEVRRSLGWGERTVVMYAGAHGRANALGQLIDTAERLANRPDILLACVGDGPERKELEAETRRRGVTNLVFYGPQPKQRMADFVNACDIGAAVLQNNPTFRTVYPNKVFDYMACERPSLLAIDGIARRLVCDEAQAGLFAEPENPDAIAEAIRQLADHPEERARLGENGRRWVLANATRDSLARRYLDVLARLTVRS